jgi:hypothetical protein
MSLGRYKKQRPEGVARQRFNWSYDAITPGSSANQNVWSAAPSQAKSEHDSLVCANVFGLCWSWSLLARMECAALFSPLVIQS